MLCTLEYNYNTRIWSAKEATFPNDSWHPTLYIKLIPDWQERLVLVSY